MVCSLDSTHQTPWEITDDSLESLIQEIQKFTAQVVGESLTEKGSQIADALANLDIMLAHISRKSKPSIGVPTSGVEHTEGKIQEILAALGFELQPIHRTMLYLYSGKQHRREGRWDQALEAYQRAHALATEQDQTALRAEALKEMGHVHSERGNWAEASEAYGNAYELFERLGDVHSLGEIQKNEAINSFQRGNYSEALERVQHLLNMAEQIDDSRLEADVHTLLGAIHDARGELEEAVTNYQRSLIYYEQNDDPAGLAQSYHNLGFTLMKRGLWQEAGEAYEQCMQLAQAYGNRPLLASVSLNRAMLYFELHDMLMAETYCEESLHLFESLAFKRGLANGYKLLGMIQSRREAYDDAARSFRIGWRLSLAIEDKQTQAEIHEAWGTMEMARHDTEQARQQLQQALALYQQLGATELAQRVESSLDSLDA